MIYPTNISRSINQSKILRSARPMSVRHVNPEVFKESLSTPKSLWDSSSNLPFGFYIWQKRYREEKKKLYNNDNDNDDNDEKRKKNKERATRIKIDHR